MTTELRFDNPNNAAHSLRVLAEMVRVGEAKVIKSSHVEGDEMDFFSVEIGTQTKILMPKKGDKK